MKQLITLAVAGLFSLFLTACGGDDHKDAEKSTTADSHMRPITHDANVHKAHEDADKKDHDEDHEHGDEAAPDEE